ncbi:hypothetical protein [Brevibacterium casei]|uniref:hypothetical protein n=1 Tax=Brevibacterium casei TaxID=33889 RepID=UPI00241CE91E|nr:hypothetical protein [Brevibacterium casei]
MGGQRPTPSAGAAAPEDGTPGTRKAADTLSGADRLGEVSLSRIDQVGATG